MSKDKQEDYSDPALTRDTMHATAVARGHGGSLRSKLVLSLAGMFFLFLTIDELVRQKVILPAFLSLERNGAIRDNNRVLAALNAEVRHLLEISRERKHTYERFERSDIDHATANADNLFGDGNVLWSGLIRRDGSGQWLGRNPVDGEQATAEKSLSEPSQLLQSLAKLCEGSLETYTGMTRIDQNAIIMFAAVRFDSSKAPLETSADSPSYFVLARSVDAELISILKRQTQVDFFLDGNSEPSPQQKLDVWEADRSTFVEVRLMDPFDQELATLLTDVPRDITQRSNQTSAMARQSFILGASAALLLLLLLLQRIVIGPLTAIREYSERVAAEGFEIEPLIIPRNDEIGELARAFHRMMQRLGAAQIRLASASRAAGMSQVADTVIHNVGNVLTNVNSLLESASNRVTKLRIEPIGKLADRLQDCGDDKALAKAMPEYLHGLANSLEQDQNDLSELLSTLNENVRHIDDVIRDQRQHATSAPAREKIALGDLVRDAIRCCQARLEGDNVKVIVSESIDEIVNCDRSMLLQILINIIGNARQALRDSDSESRSLSIRSCPMFDTNRNNHRVQLFFEDSGCGMSDSTLSNVFEAHFTTREQGTGLGLHFCAITLKRLGGSIRAESKGLGKGSTFIVELPIAEASRPTSSKPMIHHESTS